MVVSWERNAESFLADIDLPYLDASGNPTATFDPNNIRINYDFENRQWGTQFWMKEAKKRGVETLVGFANSPPVTWTIGGTAINAAANSTYSGGRWSPYASNGGDNNDNSAGNLQSAHYDTYAHYLAGIADYFAKETVPDRYRGQPQDLRFNYLSPINEPQWEWNEDKQEGSRWSNWNIARVVRRLDAVITGVAYSGINANNTKILMPEACQWNFLNTDNITNYRNQIPAFFDSSNNGTYVGNLATMKPWTIGGHTYFTHANDSDLRNIRRGARNAANNYVDDSEALQVWSTEWCGLGGGAGNIDMNNYFHVGLFMAKMAFSDIIIGGSQTFSFWTALDMERGGGARYSMVAYSPGSAIYNHDSYLTNPVYKPGAVKSQSTLWAMGHYSLFVRPGFQRIGISGSGLTYEDNDNQPLDERAVMVTAYKSPPGHRDFVTNREVKRIVTVYVNMTNATKIVAAQFPSGYGLPIAIRCYVTNEQNTNGRNDQGRNGMRVMNHTAGIIQIPARSILTAVYDFPVN
jgi:O-glycosyl hydrolase